MIKDKDSKKNQDNHEGVNKRDAHGSVFGKSLRTGDFGQKGIDTKSYDTINPRPRIPKK